jgi:transposase
MDHKNISFKDWKEARRKRAFELKEHGWKQCEIAEALGVSKAAVSQWMVKMDKSDTQAWRAKPPGHRPPKLTAKELRLLPEFLSHGAEAYRFRGELWTCARVASVIKEEFGVVYHKAHVSRLLKALDWTPQMPLERATQRDEVAIREWRVEVWPELKKGARRRPSDRVYRRSGVLSVARLGPDLCPARRNAGPEFVSDLRSLVYHERRDDGR